MRPVRIAQISDLHVRRASDKGARQFDEWLAACIERVNAASPDVVIATGDLTDCGHEEEYVRLREQLAALASPFYVMPGNHDDARSLRRVFADHAYLFENETHLSYAMDVSGLRVVALDSTIHARPGGYLDEQRLAWLDASLQPARGNAVLLALHHPPFAAGVWPMDWLGFNNRRRLETLVRATPQIKRIVSGHVHCARTAEWGGTFACTSPSPRPQHLLVGVGWRLPVLHFERAGFLMHTFDGTGGLETHVHRVDGSVEVLR